MPESENWANGSTVRALTRTEVVAAYQAVTALYPLVPPMVLWRAWELAAYRHFSLSEPVLDIGCGDGQFFRFVWPGVRDVVGIEADPGIAAAATLSGVYRHVYQTPAHELGVVESQFASAFANCSLEHMDHLDEVLARIHGALRPAGTFLLSVVTDKFIEWAPLPRLGQALAEPGRARPLQYEYEAFHHLVNPLSPPEWRVRLERAGFEVLVQAPILPELTSRAFLFMDQLWHVVLNGSADEVGDLLVPYFARFPEFSAGLVQVLAGVLQMECDWTLGSGAVFYARRSS